MDRFWDRDGNEITSESMIKMDGLNGSYEMGVNRDNELVIRTSVTDLRMTRERSKRSKVIE